MIQTVNDPLAHTSPWATEENFWLEGPNFYRAHLADDAEMWFPDRPAPLSGEALLDALRNVPRWESVAFTHQDMAVSGDRITLRYHATAQREGRDAYAAHCTSVYRTEGGALRLVEHRQRAI